mmetsp:Transcript_37215/g.55467  ORF Transcript_37215/g.55467 Transcript_37215/m.55467 type:complete len:220 (-) Transcript_37215:549-1208(-)
MREGTTLHVLAGDTDMVALQQKRTKRHCFCCSPIDAFTLLGHLATSLEDFSHLSMELEVFWNCSGLHSNVTEHLNVDSRLADTTDLIRANKSSPVACKPIRFLPFVRLGRLQVRLVQIQHKLTDFLAFFRSHGSFINQGFLKGLQRCGVFIDFTVQFGLREGGLIKFVVPIATVTDHVNDDISSKLVTPLHSRLKSSAHSERVVTVAVEDGTIKGFSQV